MKKRALPILACLVALACFVVSDAAAGPAANVFQIAAGYAAKEICSCVFVETQTDAICTPYGTAPTGVNPQVTIDHTANTVTTTLLGSTRTASFTAGQGCVLQVP